MTWLDAARKIVQSFPDNAKAFVARSPNRQEDEAVVFVVWDNHCAYYLLGGYDDKYTHHGSSLAMWEAVRFAKTLDLTYFDFEGCTGTPRIDMYARQFGGMLTPYYAVKYTRPSLNLVFSAMRCLGINRLKWD